MTDKVQKIREEVEKLKSQLLRGACSSQIAMETMCKEEAYNEVLAILDTMQEEPVSIWHDASKKSDNLEDVVIINPSDNTGEVLTGVNQGRIWAYTSELLKIYNPCNIGKNLQEPQVKKSAEIQHVNETCKENGNSLTQEPVSEDLEDAAYKFVMDNFGNPKEPLYKFDQRCFKAGANWQKKRAYIPLSDDINEVARQICNKVLNCEIDYMEDDVVLSDEEECVKAGIRWQMQKESIPSKDLLEELINNLSKRYPEVSFAKLSRIAVRVAKWQKEHLWKPADGDDLPEIDREVIAILDYDFGHYKVVYAHRPNPNGWNGTNIDTGEEEHFEPATYGKGGWNQPHVLYWLDAKMPYEEK